MRTGLSVGSPPRRPALRRPRGAASGRLSPPQMRLGPRDLRRLATRSSGPLLIFRGDRLVRHGHPFYDVYVVCSGLIEASVTNGANYVRRLGRYLPGDVIGLDALLRGNYPADFVALEPSTVCAIPLAALDEYITRPSLDG